MLNPKLFHLLERRFGYGNVLVANENMPMVASYAHKLSSRKRGQRRLTIKDVTMSGEEYKVNCCGCGETRHRLYVNHRWGVYDPQSQTRNLWLLHCFNTDGLCYSEYKDQRLLYDQVYGTRLISQPELLQPVQRKVELRPTLLPGAMWMLDDLARSRPDHPAVQYVTRRGFDPWYLATRFGVGLCVDSGFTLARDRLIAPVYKDRLLVGWEARYVGDPPDKRTPKWYRNKYQSGETFYNFDRMIRHKTIVLVEGPADVWAFGTQSGAIFGKVIRDAQVKLLASRAGEDTTVVVLLDPVYDDANERKKQLPHPIERAAAKLEEHRKFRGRVLKVYLPEPYDPGELNRWYMRDLISWQAKREGIKVDFSSRSKITERRRHE